MFVPEKLLPTHHVNSLINQLKPFDIKFHLSERVDEVKKDGDIHTSIQSVTRKEVFYFF